MALLQAAMASRVIMQDRVRTTGWIRRLRSAASEYIMWPMAGLYILLFSRPSPVPAALVLARCPRQPSH